MFIQSLGDPLPGTSNIYVWGKSQILKLYDVETPRDWIKHLGRMERALHSAGLPVPEVGELIEIEDCLGQVYERIEGSPIAEELLGMTEFVPDRVVQLAHTFADVHAQIHASSSVPEVPLQKELLPAVLRRIDALPADLKDATVRAFGEMPGGDRVCHGDFHPFNVLMTPRGPIVIDWNNAHIGNPLEDVARSTLILRGVSISQPPLRPAIDLFDSQYLERYFELLPEGRQQLDAWRPIVAAVRLADNVPELQDWLIDQIRAGLA